MTSPTLASDGMFIYVCVYVCVYVYVDVDVDVYVDVDVDVYVYVRTLSGWAQLDWTVVGGVVDIHSACVVQMATFYSDLLIRN